MTSIIETHRDRSIILVIVIPLIIFAYAMFSPHLTHTEHIAHILVPTKIPTAATMHIIGITCITSEPKSISFIQYSMILVMLTNIDNAYT